MGLCAFQMHMKDRSGPDPFPGPRPGNSIPGIVTAIAVSEKFPNFTTNPQKWHFCRFPQNIFVFFGKLVVFREKRKLFFCIFKITFFEEKNSLHRGSPPKKHKTHFLGGETAGYSPGAVQTPSGPSTGVAMHEAGYAARFRGEAHRQGRAGVPQVQRQVLPHGGRGHAPAGAQVGPEHSRRCSWTVPIPLGRGWLKCHFGKLSTEPRGIRYLGWRS